MKLCVAFNSFVLQRVPSFAECARVVANGLAFTGIEFQLDLFNYTFCMASVFFAILAPGSAVR